MTDIVVVGSLNMDLVVQTTRLPRAGETIHGEGLQRIPGGKGANQAVAAARQGAAVAMVGRVGNDDFGTELRRTLAAADVDVTHVIQDEDAVTGTAVIIVDQQGENCIVISAGANGRVASADLEQLTPLFSQAKLLLLQFEIPLEAVAQTAQLASQHGVRVILNPAPAHAISRDLLQQIDIIVPNEGELQMLTGLPVTTLDEVTTAARQLRADGIETVIVTLGGDGALLVSADVVEHIPAYQVNVVDTTGAGDTFIGTLAAALSHGHPLQVAVKRATAAAALAVTKFGAQPSLPTAAELETFISETKQHDKKENHHRHRSRH